MNLIQHTFVVLSIFVVLYHSHVTEAKADAKSNPNHHATASSKSSLIGKAVQPKTQMHPKSSKNPAQRRADVDNHGQNGFTSRTVRTSFSDQHQPAVSRTFRQTSNAPSQYSPAPTFSEPAQSSYGVPQSPPVYKPVQKEKKVIIKVLPLPIPVGTPVATPVHYGVPSNTPYGNSQYGGYNSLSLLGGLGQGLGLAPRMDTGETEQVGTRRSADADQSSFGGNFGLSDSHTHTTHHLTQSSHQQPQVIVAQTTPQQYAYPQQYGYQTIQLPAISQPQYVLVPRQQATPYANGLFGGFGGPLTPTLTNIALGNNANDLHSNFGLETAGYQNGGYGSFPYAANTGLAGNIPNALGNDPIKASFLAARSNPLIHLLAAPYIKNIKENNGEDLPTLEDLQDLLERSSFGLSGFEDEGKK